jgi:RNase P subunit RPR2
MIYCSNCQTIVSEKQNYDFSFSDSHLNTLYICDECYDIINSKLIQIDISKLVLIKRKAEKMYLNKIKT